MNYRLGGLIALIPVLAFACSESDADRPNSAAAASSLDSPATAGIARPTDARGYLIDRGSMGGINLGMTLQQAREAFPAAKFQRTSDGEGVALIEISLRPGASVIVYAGEDSPEAAIDWSKTITVMETFSEAFHTSDGLHPGSPVADVEKVYGITKSTETSEIESREYITFEKQPAWLTFRLDHTGNLPNDSSDGRNVGPKGMIFSISISKA